VRLFLDECVPRRLKRDLTTHDVATVREMGYAGLKNGALLRLIETLCDVFITVDQNLRYQQNLQTYQCAIIVLVAPTNRLEDLRLLIPAVLASLDSIQPGEIKEVGYHPTPS
jgi:hypothetical protein